MEPFRVSASQISLYSLCPRKYRYEYIEARARPTQPAALAFGSSVHAALEWAHKKQQSVGIVDIKEVLQVFKADLHAQNFGDPPLTFKEGESLEELLRLGQLLIPQALAALSKTKPLCVEEPFEVPLDEELLDGTPIHLVGVFDRIEQDGTIVEIKTSKKKYSSLDVSQHMQAGIYSLARFLRHNRIPSVRLLVLLKTSVPEVIWYETRRTAQELAWLARMVGECVRAIDAHIFTPRISWMCVECEHKAICSKEGMRLREEDNSLLYAISS